MKAAIFSIASDLQTILGEAMSTVKAIFLQKPASPKKGTLPHHLWPKYVRKDVDKIRRRVKTLRSLARQHDNNVNDITISLDIADAYQLPDDYFTALNDATHASTYQPAVEFDT